jgi:AcrR family transcriptional regulator
MARRLSADDWAEAALRALAGGGPGAVAVEPLATTLGTTKGSFYWHFSSRDDLLTAALARWEQHDTDAVIAAVERHDDPLARLRALLMLVLESTSARDVNAVELGLQAHAADPRVAPVLARVTRRRLDYLADLFAGLGLAPADARRRALLAYTAWLGHAQLLHATPELAPEGDDLRAYADSLVAALVARPDP